MACYSTWSRYQQPTPAPLAMLCLPHPPFLRSHGSFLPPLLHFASSFPHLFLSVSVSPLRSAPSASSAPTTSPPLGPSGCARWLSPSAPFLLPLPRALLGVLMVLLLSFRSLSVSRVLGPLPPSRGTHGRPSPLHRSSPSLLTYIAAPSLLLLPLPFHHIFLHTAFGFILVAAQPSYYSSFL